jgi:miniconductance mechanosensitive channel
MEQMLREYIVMLLSYVYAVDITHWLVSALEVIVYAFISYAIVYVFKSTLIKSLRTKLEKINWSVGKYLVTNNFFGRLVQLIPMLFLFTLVGNLEHDLVRSISLTSLEIIFILLLCSLFFSISKSFLNVTENHKTLKHISFEPIFQLLNLIVSIVALIFIVSNILEQSPKATFIALGSVSAVLLLIMKGTISNFVSYIQIITAKLFKRMDWVVLEAYGADGEIIKIELNLVKVKNWDKTIVTIPTSAFTTNALVNYSNMSKEGRRIKREVNIDMNTISTLSNEDIEKMSKINVLSGYINEKLEEHRDINKDIQEEDYLVNGKSLSNIGTFRKYLEYYLKNHPEIHQKHTLLVRQLKSTSEGVPIEIYCFVTNTAWVHFENVQSDIFDHIFTVLPYFGLSVYQSPSGQDFVNVLKK